MNDMEQLENQINADLALIGRFAQPAVPAGLAAAVTGAMTREYRRSRHMLWLRRLALPTAAAAAIVLAVMLLTSDTTTKGRGAEVTSIWSLGMDEGTQKVFADLDFTATTTQPAAEQNTDELEKYLLEAMNSSS